MNYRCQETEKICPMRIRVEGTETEVAALVEAISGDPVEPAADYTTREMR
jgi:hypothetical protein